MSRPVTREHGIHYTNLDPDQVREGRPWIEDPEYPVEIFAEEVTGGETWGPQHAEDRWAELANPTSTAPYERVVRDIDYGNWREPTDADVDAVRRGKGHRRLDWGVRDGDGDHYHYGSHDAARRAVHDNYYGWELAVRDMTPSPWARVGGGR
ncbi:hypothetical protein ACG83_10150 [Frankia sp. R43]|uniref:hypothetical protein n=1 Tax=Frankia sp. R43 TaxID=269536 RepID=UPI0006CA2F8C|nr:hypothetical protein [Frankia sp. R43]KPM55644.1 hypothetical protein ACG83_10150 [Frankia sp. R43]